MARGLPERLAARYAAGKATSFQAELLASLLLEMARQTVRAACASGRLPWREMDDAIQEATIRCLARMDTFHHKKASLKTWCSAIARRICADMARKLTKEATIFLDGKEQEL